MSTATSKPAPPTQMHGKILKRSKWLGRFVAREATLKNGTQLVIYSERKNGGSVTLDLLNMTNITFCYDQQKKAVLMVVNQNKNERVREFLLDGAGTDWSKAFSWCPSVSAAPQANMRVTRVRIVPIRPNTSTKTLATVTERIKDTQQNTVVAPVTKAAETKVTETSGPPKSHSVVSPLPPAAAQASPASLPSPCAVDRSTTTTFKADLLFSLAHESSTSVSMHSFVDTQPTPVWNCCPAPSHSSVASTADTASRSTDPAASMRALANESTGADYDEWCTSALIGAAAFALLVNAIALYILVDILFDELY